MRKSRQVCGLRSDLDASGNQLPTPLNVNANNCADIIPSSSIVVAENKILSIRDTQVILDRDLAELYGVETRVLNQAVSRNIERFPLEFRFQLTADEFDNLKSHFVISSWGGVRKLPFAFTEQGVAMLSALLRSPQAITTSVAIMKAFVAMRRYLTANAQILHRLDRLDRKQLENEQDFEKIFAKFEENEPVRQGVFFDGQTYDAYAFVSDRIREAKVRRDAGRRHLDQQRVVLLQVQPATQSNPHCNAAGRFYLDSSLNSLGVWPIKRWKYLQKKLSFGKPRSKDMSPIVFSV